MNTTMSKEDWIILRLIAETVRAEPFCALDHIKALTHLIKTYGEKQVNACIDQLDEERT